MRLPDPSTEQPAIGQEVASDREDQDTNAEQRISFMVGGTSSTEQVRIDNTHFVSQ